jgi:hypothetical protein
LAFCINDFVRYRWGCFSTANKRKGYKHWKPYKSFRTAFETAIAHAKLSGVHGWQGMSKTGITIQLKEYQ